MLVDAGTAVETEFQFGSWSTPFENADVDLLDVAYLATKGALAFKVALRGTDTVYIVNFGFVSAFRVLDEHGLPHLWEMTQKLSGRSGKTTFKTRNGHWSLESPISFLSSDGWSFVVATDWTCIEIVAAEEPTIALDQSSR